MTVWNARLGKENRVKKTLSPAHGKVGVERERERVTAVGTKSCGEEENETV